MTSTQTFKVVNDRPYYWVVRVSDGFKLKVYMNKRAAQDLADQLNSGKS